VSLPSGDGSGRGNEDADLEFHAIFLSQLCFEISLSRLPLFAAWEKEKD